MTCDVFDPYVDWKAIIDRVPSNINVLGTEMEAFALFHIARILGKNQNVLKLRVEDAGRTEIDAMYFGDVKGFQEYVRAKFGENSYMQLFRGRGNGITMAFTYYPSINVYQGIKTPHIVIQNYK